MNDDNEKQGYRLDSPVRQRLKEELEKLIDAGKWNLIKTWFSVWENEEEMVHKCHLWGFMFMTDYFRAKGCDAHLDLIKGNLSKHNEFNAFPRGFAKTTINQLCIAFECANGTVKFVPVIEKTFNDASQVLEGIRSVFTNKVTKLVYGNLIGRTVDGDEAERQPDAKGDMFINGVRLRALGFNKTIRGLKTGAWRPDKIYIDDVEEDEHIGNPEQRQKYLSNYSKGILPALDIDGSLKVRGTILHFDSLLYNLIEQHNGKIYKAFDRYDPKKTLLWPQYWTYEKLMQKKEDMSSQGMGVNAFYQEYLNEPISEEERDFKWDDITLTYKEEDLKFKDVNLFAAIDVADTVSEGSDYTGVVVEAIDKEGNWYNKVTRRYKIDVLGLIDLIFELWAMPNMRKIGVEKKAFEDQIKPLLDREMNKRGMYPIVVELKHGGKRKIDRIKGALQGRYRQRKIFNQENPQDNTKDLWDELYSVGGGTIASKNDDLMDAKAYVAQIAEEPLGQDFYSRWKKTNIKRWIDPIKLLRSKAN